MPVEDTENTEATDLKSLSPSSFLPKKDDVLAISQNLKVLVLARILCKYIKCLSPLSKQVSPHISHEHPEKMAENQNCFV